MEEYKYLLGLTTKHDNTCWNDCLTEKLACKMDSLSDEDKYKLLLELEGFYKKTISDNSQKSFNSWDRETWWKLRNALMERFSTTKLLSILYGDTFNVYKRHYSYYGPDYGNAPFWLKNDARDELRRRYENGIDSSRIAGAFVMEDDKDAVWLMWQKRKSKVAEARYKDAFKRRMKEYETFADEEFVEDSPMEYDTVIWIKNGGCFLGCGIRQLDDLTNLLLHDYRLSTQYVGIGKDIWLGIVDDERLSNYDDFYDWDNEKRHREEYQRKLVQGCLLIEKLAQQTCQGANVWAKVCEKKYLLGKFVLEICDLDKLCDNE